MRRYIYSALVVVMTLLATACENDPITISYGVPVKVDPSGVISTFTYEIKTGELESFPASYKLRVRLLAYDMDGKLASEETAFVSNYAGILNTTLRLPDGTYTLVALTDVVKYESNNVTLEYWKLTGMDDINEVKVTNAGMIGGKYKILGLASQRVSVVNGEVGTVTLNPKSTGALLCIRFLNIHTFSDVTDYKLQTNRNADYMSLDSQGQPVTVPKNENNTFKWLVGYVKPMEEGYTDGDYFYSWNYMFPVSNANYRFVYSTSSVSDEVLVSDMIVSLNAGDEYLFMLDLCDEEADGEITYLYRQVNGNTNASRMANLPMTPWKEKQMADALYTSKLKDLIGLSDN